MTHYLKSTGFRSSTVASEDMGVPELSAWAPDVLLGKFLAPLCSERGVRQPTWDWFAAVCVKEGVARAELLLPPGWCPYAASLFAQAEDQVAGQPVARAGRLRPWRDTRVP